jgi:hypothetical protein
VFFVVDLILMTRCGALGKLNSTWVLLALLLVQFACLFRPDAMAWDGAFYYAYTRSVVCDGDLVLRNDLLLLYAARDDPYFEGEHFEDVFTPTGRVSSPFAIGASLLWLPWFALIYALARLAGWVGLGPTTLTCYEWPFVWGMATVTCVYGWIGVVVGFRLAKKFVNEWAALIASAVAMFATPLLYYQFREPFYAHAASAMVTALFVFAWWHFAERRDDRLDVAFLLGMLGGLAALVRPQNVTYLILPVLTVLLSARTVLPGRRWSAIRRTFAQVVLIGSGGLLVLTLQFSFWHVFYGQPLTVPQGSAFMDWSAPWAKHVLFSSFHGLLPWLPLTLPAVVGLLLSARRLPRLSIPLLIAFLLQVYVNSCVRDWFGGGGYGARRFSSALVVFLVGYACLIGWRKKFWFRLLVILLSGFLVLHQWLILSYGLADSIGGYVVGMSPTYEWYADGIAQFVWQLGGYVPMMIRNPFQRLVFSDSPLGVVWTSPFAFACQVLLLAGVLGIVRFLPAGYRWLSFRYTVSRAFGRSALFCVVALILLADWWILFCA